MYVCKHTVNFTDEMNMTDLDMFTEAVLTKLNSVIDKIAPTRRIQIKRRTNDFKDKKAKEIYKEAKTSKSRAIKNNDAEEFRRARNLVAIAKKKNYVTEARALTAKLHDNKKKWKTVNNSKGEETFPTALVKDGKLITSQKGLADTLAETFDTKVSK